MITTYKPQNVALGTLNDSELIELISACSNLFGTNLTERAMMGFKMLIEHKFMTTTDKRVFDTCMAHASNPSNSDERFAPRFLSRILSYERKDEYEYKPKYVSDEEKAQIWETFKGEIYEMFDEYLKTKDVQRIAVWAYICRLLKEKGYIHDEAIEVGFDKNKARASKTTTLNTVFSDGHKELALNAFHHIASEGKHLSDVIY